jgi:hypothetical protein
LETLKDTKALEEWNWQVKERARQGRSTSKDRASVERARRQLSHDSDKNEMEGELLRMDQEIISEGGHYFTQGGSIRKGSRGGLKSAMKTPSTVESQKSENVGGIFDQ